MGSFDCVFSNTSYWLDSAQDDGGLHKENLTLTQKGVTNLFVYLLERFFKKSEAKLMNAGFRGFENHELL